MDYAGVLLACPSSRGDLQRGTAGVILSLWSPWRPCSEQHGSSHHHEVSILGLVYHRLWPGAEVHRTLFARLDFNLNAGDHCRRILTFWSPTEMKALTVSHLPWTTLTAFCLLAITQSLVRSSNKWSHRSTRSPWKHTHSGIAIYITLTQTFSCFSPPKHPHTFCLGSSHVMWNTMMLSVKLLTETPAATQACNIWRKQQVTKLSWPLRTVYRTLCLIVASSTT